MKSEKKFQLVYNWNFFSVLTDFFSVLVSRGKELPQYFMYHLMNWIFAAETIQGRKLNEKIRYLFGVGYPNIFFQILICIFHSRSTTVGCKNYWNLSIGNWQKIGDLLTGSKTQQCNILASALLLFRLQSFQKRDTKLKST